MGNFAVVRHLRGMDTDLTRALAAADAGGNDLGAVADTVRGRLASATTHLDAAVAGMADPGVRDAVRNHLLEVGGLRPAVSEAGMRDSLARATEAWTATPTTSEELRQARNALVLPHERADVATEDLRVANSRRILAGVAAVGVVGLIGVRAAVGSQAAHP